MKPMGKHSALCGLTAALLCLCMLVQALGGVGPFGAAALASEAPGASVRKTGEPTEYIVDGSRVADPNTMDDYLNRLLTMENGSRYAGRVWTDKTVFAYDATKSAEGNIIKLDMATDGYDGNVKFNADFAHVFSALASSQVVNEYPPSPVDLVIVFDMSASMGQDTRYGIDGGANYYVTHNTDNDLDENGEPLEGDNAWPSAGVPMDDRIANSRIQTTLNAINNTIDQLMEQNPQNRVAVCGYGANATVLMPLAHYRHAGNDKDKPYLTVGGMETLYHPSDLVYKNDNWYWMNNRDTCYTVVVNAEGNNYTGVLDDDGSGKTNGEDWKPVQKVVSNNVLDSEGKPVKAFPGVSKQTADTLTKSGNDYGETSRQIRDAAGCKYQAGGKDLIIAMENTRGLEADEYVGYFTNTQGGIYLAYKQLADSTATTYTETLSNGVVSTVARIPAAIIMSDGGANFAFNEMGGDNYKYRVKDWNLRYGQRTQDSVTEYNKTEDKSGWNSWKENSSHPVYMNDDLWSSAAYGVSESVGRELKDDTGEPLLEGHDRDNKHRLSDNVGDEWYNVFLPGNDTLDHDENPEMSDKGYWKGLEGLYNIGADYFKDGTLSSQPAWNNAGVLFNSDNNIMGTSSVIMEIWLTAAYMHDVVQKHYSYGWEANNATLESRNNLSTYTMNVDTAHVPLWGKMRLFPTLDPKTYDPDKIEEWYATVCPEDELESFLNEKYGSAVSNTEVNNLWLFVDGYDAGGGNGYTGLKEEWDLWKTGGTASPAVLSGIWDKQTSVAIKPIQKADDEGNANYTTQIEKNGKLEAQVIGVTDADVIANIQYNDKFYDVTSADLSGIFNEILALILGKVFVPVSGDNDAGVGDSITYQDPIGEYMEVKDGSIVAKPHHIDNQATGEGQETTYDMALLVFGEMHGLVRVGVYDYQWNDQYMREHPNLGEHGKVAFPMGWYWGDDPKTAQKADDATNIQSDNAGTFPAHSVEGPYKEYNSAAEARADGWVYRVNFQTLIQFVPIVDAPTSGLPDDLSPQVMNTKYTLYRFAGSQKDRNALHRNPIYGDVPDELKTAWKVHEDAGTYPVGNSEYAGTPDVYRLSDIRVWVEDTGDFVDTDGAFTPNTGYDRSLYVNIPAAAIPTELATVTLGRDGVLSYKTNLGSDHTTDTKITVEEGGKKTTRYVTEDEYKDYCYQSTPFRLFYAVGLEDDLILRNKAGRQIGVDVSKISPEYMSTHTVEGKDYIWFISNYYSGTRYEGYATDETSRTRGDPTVTFSPGSDNRYYVFQKPLPLYAHAYRIHLPDNDDEDPSGAPVDHNDTEHVWRGDGSGNGSITWEVYNGQQQAGSWVGGRFMGVYATRAYFMEAYKEAKESKTGKIKDSHGVTYDLVDGGIIFSEEDILDHVTSTPDGSGYMPGSKSFSSDDYFFILLEFYVPNKDPGKDNEGKDLYGTHGGSMVQWAVARKGSEFGSGFASDKITNGSMLCWTDTENHLNVEFAYVSRTETGDDTRGEPTFEKLTYKQPELENYLRNTCHISSEEKVPNPDYNPDGPDTREEISALEQQVKYWTKMQADPQVRAALVAANGGNEDLNSLDRDTFKNYFHFAVAARPGGIRSGDMSNNLHYKGTTYNAGTQLYNDNVTGTSNTYYLPTISDDSGTDNNVIINNYLGNNGRLEIGNEALHITKLLQIPDSYTEEKKAEMLKEQSFNYQLYVEGLTGTHNAIVTEYNQYSEPTTWERKLAYIDVLTDNSDLVQTNSDTRALFVEEDTTISTGESAIIARQVILGDDAKYYYANEDGTRSDVFAVTEEDANLYNLLYYLYLPHNGTGVNDTATLHVHRLYQDTAYEGADAADFPNVNKTDDRNGITTFVKEGTPITPSIPGDENRKSLREADGSHKAGTKTYWCLNAELIPVKEVMDAEASTDSLEGVAGIALESTSSGWKHDEAHEAGGHKAVTYHDFVVRRPSDEGSETKFSSPYKTRTQYMTTGLTFGVGEGDLYDSSLFNDLSAAEIAANTASFTLKSGEGVLLQGLNDNSDYRVTEKLTERQFKNGYTLQRVEHVQQESTDDHLMTGGVDMFSVSGDTGLSEEQAHYTNTVIKSDLSIEKKVEIEGGGELNKADLEKDFTFTLTLREGGTDVPAEGPFDYGVYTAAGNELLKEGKLLAYVAPGTPVDPAAPAPGGTDISADAAGIWTFPLKAGQVMHISGLNPGTDYTYTAEEEAVSGYTVKSEIKDDPTGDSDTRPEAVKGTVTTGTKEEVIFTNTRQPASLIIEKQIVNGDGTAVTDKDRLDQAFNFKLALTLPDTLPKETPLTFPVTRSTMASAAVAPPVEVLPLAEGAPEIAPEGDGEPAPVSNDEPAPLADPEVIILTWSEDDNAWVGSFTLKHGETMTITGLPGDAAIPFTLTEDAVTPYVVSAVVEPTGAGTYAEGKVTGMIPMPGGDTAEAKVTVSADNTVPVPGIVSLAKRVQVTDPENDAYTLTSGDFTFTVWAANTNPKNDPLPVYYADSIQTKDGREYWTVMSGAPVNGTALTTIIPEAAKYETTGTYRYYVQETESHIPGVSIDSSVFRITVEVVQTVAEDGTTPVLKPGVTVEKLNNKDDLTGPGTDVTDPGTEANPATFTFTNVYNHLQIIKPIRAHKTLNGGALTKGQFTFTLTPGESTVNGVKGTSPMPKELTKEEVADGAEWREDDSVAVKNMDGGAVVFPDIVYEEPGVYNYTLSETKEENGSIVYDETVYDVVVTVKRNAAENALEAEVTYQKRSNDPAVTYPPEAYAAQGAPFVNTIFTKPEKEETDPGDGKRVEIGDPVTYSVEWNNYKSEAATVIITDKLDPGADFAVAGIPFPAEGAAAELTLQMKAKPALTEGGYYSITGPVSVGTETIDAEIRYYPLGYKQKTKTDAEGHEVPNPDDPGRPHAVVWILTDAPKNSTGKVQLQTVVNENAARAWGYGTDADKSAWDRDGWTNADPNTWAERDPDQKIYNRAGVKVGNDVEQLTNIPENPVEGKTETAVNDTPNPKLEMNADDGSLEGPTVQAGDSVSYRIYWVNDATETKQDAAGTETVVPAPAVVRVLDKLDPGVDFAQATYTLPDGIVLTVDTATEETDHVRTATGEIKTTVTGPDGTEQTVTIPVIIRYYSPEYTPTETMEANPATNAPQPHSIEWVLGEKTEDGTKLLPAGAEGHVDFKVTVNNEARKTYNYPDGTTPDPETPENDWRIINRGRVVVNEAGRNTETVTNPTGGPDKKETLPGDGVSVEVGEEITYEVTWHNYLESAARIVVTDKLDPGADFEQAAYKLPDSDETVTLTKDTAADENGVKAARSQDGKITISYYPDGTADGAIPAHTVVWDLGEQPAGRHDTVTLAVRVNENAVKTWNYGNDPYEPAVDGTPWTAPALGEEKDMMVYNQAQVTVGNEAQVTRRVENPLTEPGLVTLVKRVQSSATESEKFAIKANDFTFTVRCANTNPADDPLLALHPEGKWTVTNGAPDGSGIALAEIIPAGTEYASENTYVYYVKESACGIPGVSIDPGEFTVTVTVKRNAAGDAMIPAVTITRDGQSAEKIEFTNTYDRERVHVPIRAFKTLQGGTLTAGQFAFTLAAKDGAPMPADAVNGQATVTNQGSGTVTFPEIIYETPGEYHYTLSEKQEAGGSIVYDTTAYEVTVAVVKDAQTNALSVTVAYNGVQYNDDGAPFVNRIPGRPEKRETDPGDGVMVGVGQEIMYEITWENYKSEAADVIVRDKLDPGVDFTTAAYGNVKLDMKAEPAPVLTEDGYYEAADEDVAVRYYPADYIRKTVDSEGKPIIDPGQPHTVVWILKTQPAGMRDTVALTVEVNARAYYAWNYTNPEADVNMGEKDRMVYNRAGVQVGNDDEIYTEIVENPLPEKTETQINDTEITVELGQDGTKTVRQVQIGDTITYRLYWTNGHDTEADVIISDILDRALDFVSADKGGQYSEATHTVVWTLRAKAHESGYVELTVRVNGNAKAANDGGYEIVNKASVRVGDDPSVETNPVENPLPEKTETKVNGSTVSPESLKPDDKGGLMGPSVEIGDTVEYRISFRNGYDRAAKVTVRDRLDPGVDFVSAGCGEVTLTANAGQNVTVENGNVSITYDAETRTVTWTVKEFPADTAGYVTLTVRVNEKAPYTWNPGDTELGTGKDDMVRNRASVQIDDEPEVNTEIVDNPVGEPKTGSLIVTKTVTGEGAEVNKAFTFTVRLSDVSINGTYGDMTFVNGVATFTLKHGESKKAAGLPAGVHYTVIETLAEDEHYTASTVGDTGVIEGGQESLAAFLNTYAPPPDVPKTGDRSHPGFWMGVSLLALLGLVWSVMTGKKRSDR